MTNLWFKSSVRLVLRLPLPAEESEQKPGASRTVIMSLIHSEPIITEMIYSARLAAGGEGQKRDVDKNVRTHILGHKNVTGLEKSHTKTIAHYHDPFPHLPVFVRGQLHQHTNTFPIKG